MAIKNERVKGDKQIGAEQDNCLYQVTESDYGTKYKYRIKVVGPNGKTKNVIAVYQVDKGNNIPRLITNYLEEK